MSFGAFQLLVGGSLWWLGVINVLCGLAFLSIPRLCPLGEIVAPVTFVVFAYLSVGFFCYTMGTGSGLQFYFLVSASLVVLVLGIERIRLAAVIAAIGVVLIIALELTVPNDRGIGPPWMLTVASSAPWCRRW